MLLQGGEDTPGAPASQRRKEGGLGGELLEWAVFGM